MYFLFIHGPSLAVTGASRHYPRADTIFPSKDGSATFFMSAIAVSTLSRCFRSGGLCPAPLKHPGTISCMLVVSGRRSHPFEPAFSIEEAAARFFPSGVSYDRAMGNRYCMAAQVRICAGSRRWQRRAPDDAAESGDLISLAAWLRRQALDARATPETATQLERASEIVKEAADRKRHERIENCSFRLQPTKRDHRLGGFSGGVTADAKKSLANDKR